MAISHFHLVIRSLVKKWQSSVTLLLSKTLKQEWQIFTFTQVTSDDGQQWQFHITTWASSGQQFAISHVTYWYPSQNSQLIGNFTWLLTSSGLPMVISLISTNILVVQKLADFTEWTTSHFSVSNEMAILYSQLMTCSSQEWQFHSGIYDIYRWSRMADFIWLLTSWDSRMADFTLTADIKCSRMAILHIATDM